MVVLDTCALLWWTLDPDRLSGEAQKACEQIYDKGAYISSISIWEIGIKIEKKSLNIGEDIQSYMRRLLLLGSLEIVPVDETIWLKNLALEWEHNDPVDRTIVATAMSLDVPIITKDDSIRNFYQKIIW
ncbi:type II toxin-antitoxin system VapC family toxin [candidate division KSB1 bacterium]|nr:type II toxin-antitoxin system VapC family toxin [candidate division KSB1 bacterium]